MTKFDLYDSTINQAAQDIVQQYCEDGKRHQLVYFVKTMHPAVKQQASDILDNMSPEDRKKLDAESQFFSQKRSAVSKKQVNKIHRKMNPAVVQALDKFIRDLDPVIQARAHELYDNLTPEYKAELHSEYDQARSETVARLMMHFIKNCVALDSSLTW